MMKELSNHLLRPLRASLLLLLLLPALHACGQESYEEMLDALYSHTVPLVQPAALSAMQDSSDVLLLDAREEGEYAVSHLDGAQWVGYDTFKKATVKDLPRDQPVVVYCSVGYRSERIAEQLQAMGFTQVYNLYGGIFEWKNQGLEVVAPSGAATDSVHVYNELWGQWLLNGIKVYD